MKNKKLFCQAINTLLWSFGSEPPAEVIWGVNELLDWYEEEYGVKLGIRLTEEDLGKEYKEMISAIKERFSQIHMDN